MQARPLAVAACLLASCHDDPAPTPAEPENAVRAAPEPPEASSSAPEDPWQARLAARELAPSGLGPGSELLTFRSVDVVTGDTVCPLERAPDSAKAKVIAVGTLHDEAFARDLQDLDAIVYKYEGTLAAVAVFTDIEDGRAIASRDPETVRAEARDRIRALDLTIPVVVPTDEQDDDDTWTRYYNVTTSRTVMLVDAENRVVFSKVEPEDWSELDAAFRDLLGRRTG
jgi:hypothetical protein